MTYRQTFRKSRLAEWGFKLSIFSAHIIVFTVVLHRYAGQSTAVALNLLQIGFVGAFIALILSIVAAFQIWNKLLSGFGKSVAGALISLLVLIWPTMMLPVYFVTPQLYDVTTNLKLPPEFKVLKKFREFGSNPTNFIEREAFASDVLSVRILTPGQDTFDLVRQLVLKRKWELISVKPPGKKSGLATIEAVDRSLVLAAPDDIVIRIQSKGAQSVLDMRSAARYGSYDLGRNQKRIQQFLEDVINQSANATRIKPGEPLYLSRRTRVTKKLKAQDRDSKSKKTSSKAKKAK